MDNMEVEENGPTVTVTEEELAKLTVSEIKAELSGRDVPFLSKERKPQLLEPLKSSLHSPAVNDVMRPATKMNEKKERKEQKEMALAWNDSHPARHLLWTEMIAGNTPLDPTMMGPAEVHCTHSGTLKFQMHGMECGPAFTRCLGDLRK